MSGHRPFSELKLNTLLADIRSFLPDIAQMFDEMKIEREQSGTGWTDYNQEQRERLTNFMRRIDALNTRTTPPSDRAKLAARADELAPHIIQPRRRDGEQEVERVARAIFDSHNATYTFGGLLKWESDPEHWRRYARAALSAMQDSGAIGELTQELIAIRVAALNGEDDALDVILAATERALYASKAKSQ